METASWTTDLLGGEASSHWVGLLVATEPYSQQNQCRKFTRLPKLLYNQELRPADRVA